MRQSVRHLLLHIQRRLSWFDTGFVSRLRRTHLAAGGASPSLVCAAASPWVCVRVAMEANLLIVLMDCSAAWAGGGDGATGALEFGATVEAVAVLLRAFLALRQSNRVAVHGVSASHSKLLVGESLDEMRRLQGAHVVHQAVAALHKFCSEEVSSSVTWSRVRKPLNRIVQSAGDSAGQAELSRGLAAALCYTHHVRASKPALRSRVLIVQRSHDCAPKYVQTMNCIFAAQHETVPLDALVLRTHDSTYLQQGEPSWCVLCDWSPHRSFQRRA